jgi:hypothetical protein
MSSFVVGGTTVNFTIDYQGFFEHKANLLRTWDFTVLLANATDYASLAGLWSGPVNVRACPGSAGATPYVDIAGGAGKGTLTIDNASDSPYTAALVRMDRPSAYPSGGRRCTVSFQECP